MLAQPKAWLTAVERTDGPRNRIRLSAAHDEWNHVGIALAAMHEGFFADEGLTDVELITFPEESTEVLVEREAAQVDLIARGAVDIGIDPRTTFLLQAKDQGKPVCIVAARRKSHAFILVGQKGLQSIHDLRGMTVFENQPGGATDVMFRQALRDSEIEPDRDVTFHYTGGAMHDTAGVIRAFREGKGGPAIMAATAETPKLVADGFPVLMDLRTRYPSRHDRVTGANEDFVNEHPDQLQAFLKGMIRGCRWVLDVANSDRFKEIVVSAGFLTTERERQSFDSLFAGWQTRGTRDLDLPRDGIELIVDESKRDDLISPSFDLDSVLRLEQLRLAQQALPDTEAAR